jgi:hypothetical protein
MTFESQPPGDRMLAPATSDNKNFQYGYFIVI